MGDKVWEWCLFNKGFTSEPPSRFNNYTEKILEIRDCPWRATDIHFHLSTGSRFIPGDGEDFTVFRVVHDISDNPLMIEFDF